MISYYLPGGATIAIVVVLCVGIGDAVEEEELEEESVWLQPCSPFPPCGNSTSSGGGNGGNNPQLGDPRGGSSQGSSGNPWGSCPPGSNGRGGIGGGLGRWGSQFID